MAKTQLSEWDFECRIRSADNEVRWIWTKGRYQFNDQGQPISLVGVIKDIQERKNSELAIQALDAQLTETQRLAGVGSWVWDIATNSQTWTDETYQIYQLDTSQPPPSYQEIQKFFTPASWEEISQAVELALAEGKAYECDLEMIRTDGVRCWITARGMAIPNADGKIVQLQGTVQDITHRKQIELATQLSEQRFRRLFQESPLPLGLMNKNGEIVNINSRFEQLFGYTRQDVPTLSEWWLRAYPDPKYRAQVQENWNNSVLSAATLGTDIQPQEYRITCLNGEIRDVIISGIIIADEFLATFYDVTERNKLAQEVLAGKEKLEAALNSMTDAVFISDKSGLFIEFNQAFATFHKFKNKAECAKSIAEYPAFLEVSTMTGEPLALEHWAVPRALQGESATSAEFNLRRKDTGESWIGSYSYAPIRNHEGTVVGSVVTARDITQHKLMNLEMQRWADAFQYCAHGIVIANPIDNTIKLCNPAFALLEGYNTPKELEGLAISSLYSPGSFAGIRTLIAIADESGQVSFESKHRKKDGNEFDVQIDIVSVKDMNNNILYRVATVQDISKRKKYEDQLGLQSTALEVVGNAIMITNPKGLIEWVNPAFTALTGYQLDESVNHTPAELSTSDYQSTEDYQKLWEVISAGNIWHGEMINRRKDGSLYTEEQTITPLLNKDGEILHYIAIKQDITKRKSQERELNHYRQHLEQLVEERTYELSEARIEAERLSKVKGVFLVNMSHEIRTPMNAVLGFCYLLQQLPLDNYALELVNKIDAAGRSLLAIINDILDFTKIEAGHLAIENIPFQLSEVLDNLAAIMESSARYKNLDLVITPPIGINHLLGDGLRLQQVLVNLLSNAIKFTEQGSVALSIEVASISASSCDLRFVVTDTGIGISAEKQIEIFSAFTQADTSISRRFGGTGLGLSISQQLVQLMGGNLIVKSQVGHGSEFSFTLALAMDRQQAAYDSIKIMHKVHLLIIESSTLVRNALLSITKSLNWTAEAVDSVHSVQLQTADNYSPYDVILLDWKPLESADLSTTLHILSNIAKPQNSIKRPIIIMMVAAYSRNEIQENANMSLIDGFIIKPITPSALLNTVTKLLNHKEHPLISKPLPNSDTKLRFHGTQILVVDDSEINREVAKRILEGEGATVLLASDGQQAIDSLQAHSDSIDIVLMDVQMPVMDGYTATRQIRQNERWQHLPIIALTAGAFDSLRDTAFAAGMDDFIAKPFNVEQLLTVIHRFTQNQLRLSSENTSINSVTNILINQQTATQSQPESLLPNIEYELGLEHWGDATVYHQYLSKFIAEYGNAGTNILAYMQQENQEEAKNLAHKLTGVAGNLYLQALAAQSRIVYQMLSAGIPYAEAIEKLQHAINDACMAITAKSSDNVHKTATIIQEVPINCTATNETLMKLLHALELHELDVAETLLTLLQGSIADKVFAQVQAQLLDFDFYAAKNTIQSLITNQK